MAFGIYHYTHLIDDKDFLYGHGAEMLVEISRFLEARGDWSQLTHKFGFFGVMGPDEFQVMVNHNAYTNYMGKMTFEYTIHVLNEMKEKAPEKYEELKKKTGVTEEEIASWQNCADNTLIIQDENGIFEQHQGFFDLPHIDVDAIPVTDFPLYSHWSYDHIYRNDMIKQPDVLMFQFLYNQQFSSACKKANYEYYEPRTIHESSVNIVYGFGGMRSDGDILLFKPSIPAAWKSYTFRVEYKGAILCIKVSKESAEFKTLNGKTAHIRIYDKDYDVDGNGVTVEVPECWRG